ncbi:MAG: hypothetical protein ACHQIM_01165 [Sphingobacteriales bacterium]
MKKNLIHLLYSLLLLGCFVISSAFMQPNQPVINAAISGLPPFTCSSTSNMPIGATGGLLTIVKTSDNTDQELNKALKSGATINSVDIIYYKKSANGRLIKTEAFHFAKLQVKSVVPNVNKVTAISFSYATMVKD